MSADGMWRRLIVCAALASSAAGCGGAFTVTPARITLTDPNGLSITDLRDAIGPMLEAGGFDDLGVDDEMIALTRRSTPDERAGALRAESLLHEYTYLNERRNLRVVVTDYTDVARGRPSLAYEAPAGPFFEIKVYEERPGGFSSAGYSLLVEIQQELETLDAVVTLATPPPATDNAEYWRVTLNGFFGGILAWLAAFSVTVAVTGGMSYGVLKRAPIPINAKRGLFIMINAWLATPLPFPVATILVWTLPNLLAFPWTYPDYYRRVLDLALVSFPISLALCALIARKLFGVSKTGAAEPQR